MKSALWMSMKRLRRISVGPLSFLFTFRRRVRITPGTGLRLNGSCQSSSGPSVAELPDRELAVIVGVGPGLGHALAARLAREHARLVLISRNADALDPLVETLRAQNVEVSSYGCDATDESQVSGLFRRIRENLGTPSLVVYSLQEFGRSKTLDTTVAAFESAWRHNCLGAFLDASAAGREMLPRQAGSIILVGSTSSIIGREEHLNLAVGKFGQRALAQVLARELWASGIHVAHVIVDADIAEDTIADESQADPYDVAQAIISVHRQPATAWTSELDIRPAKERFWEHC